MKKAVALLVLAASLMSCSMPMQGKLYNLKTGQVTPVTYTYNGSGKGTIIFTVDGRQVTGEYVTVAQASTWGSIYGTYGGVAANSTQRGAAVAADGKGFVIQCEYTTDVFTGGGAGYCEDNAGVGYRMTF